MHLILGSKIVLTDPYVPSKDLQGRKPHRLLPVRSSSKGGEIRDTKNLNLSRNIVSLLVFVATAHMRVATMPSIQKSVSLSVLYFRVSPNYERNQPI